MQAKIQPLPVPRFSLAERERRWKKVRQLMEPDGLDAIVAPSLGGLQAAVRYQRRRKAPPFMAGDG